MIGGSYILQIYRYGVPKTVLVWNGVKGYRRAPNDENLSRIRNTDNLPFGKNVVIAQISKPTIGSRACTEKVVFAALAEADSIILWARDTRTFDSIVNELRMKATAHRDGTPMTKQ